jgi:hypothetical protein
VTVIHLLHGEQMKLFITFLAITFSLNLVAMNIALEISMHQKLLLHKINKSVYKQNYSEEASKMSFHFINDEEEVYSVDHQFPPEINNSENIQIFILKNKKTVRFIDLNEEINQVIPAKITKSFFGEIASIKINQDIMKSLYSKSLEAEGLLAIAELGLEYGDLTINKNFLFSDFTCEKGSEGMICKQDMLLDFAAKNKKSND